MSFDRRTLLISVLALGACGFTPAYGPDGGAQRLQGRVGLTDPEGRDGYLLNQRLQDRLGPPRSVAYGLTVQPTVKETGLGATADGFTTRYQLAGVARFALVDHASGKVLVEGSVNSFTGYSASGSTVATLTARKDAHQRLMVILADMVVDRLVLAASGLPE